MTIGEFDFGEGRVPDPVFIGYPDPSGRGI